MTAKDRDRILKVRRLARESPEEGERAAARRFLAALMKRHGLDVPALERLAEAAREAQKRPAPRPAPVRPAAGVVFVATPGWCYSDTTTSGASGFSGNVGFDVYITV